MSLKLKRHESIPSGLRRIITGRLQGALRELDRAGAQADDAVHNARKRLKEARAVLRLLRPALPELIYETERSAYRDSARPLSSVRDARVLIDALDRLVGSASEHPLEVGTIRNELEARRAHLHQELSSSDRIERLRQMLGSAVSRVADWPVGSKEWRTVREGFRPTYRRGRRLMRGIADASAPKSAGRSDETLHEWRKQAKALWYQLQVLENAWPGMLEPLAEEVHKLTDLLGEDHDLAVLRGLVGANGASGLPLQDRDRLLDRIDQHRSELQANALETGNRIYAEPTKAFLRRIGRYWRAWRDSQPSAAAGEIAASETP